MPRGSKSRDGLVVSSIVIVSIAASVMCFSQIGLAGSVSVAVGVVTLALLMLVHKQLQKSAQIAQLKAELAQTRQAATPAAARRAPPSAPSPSATSAETRIRDLSRGIGNLVARSDAAPAGPASAASPTPAEHAFDRAMRRAARSLPQELPEGAATPTTEGIGEMPDAAHPAAQALSGAPQAASTEPVREQWSFRPRSDAQASVQDASVATNVAGSGVAGPRGGVAATVEGDLELVQRKIKELADEVNAAEALRPKPPRINTVSQGRTGPLEESIGALKAAAKSMRERPSLGDFIPKFEAEAFAPQPSPASPKPQDVPAAKEGLGELFIPATAERIAGSDTPAPGQLRAGERDVAPPRLELPLPGFDAAPAATLPPRLAEIARAVEDDAMDILLGPIVTLAEHSVSHYKTAVKLRTPSGDAIDYDEDDFAAIGGELDVRFDIARFNRAAALAARMDARDRNGLLLAEFLGSSMTSRAFLETFALAYESRKRISQQLVLTFSQRAVEEFSPSAWQAVRDMHAFGFQMALDKIRHVGTDFAALQHSGFRFVRLDARAILEGMTTPERFVPAEEIVQRATLAGLSIIAGGIADAETQARLLQSGILLGQGPLFGAPRQVNVASGGGAADQSAAA